jgi:hypothetical protein
MLNDQQSCNLTVTLKLISVVLYSCSRNNLRERKSDNVMRRESSLRLRFKISFHYTRSNCWKIIKSNHLHAFMTYQSVSFNWKILITQK